MDIVLTSLAFLIATACAGAMGFAIQRGATCTVAAVDELLTKRSARRLASLIEASVWVAGGLLLAQALHRLPDMPGGYALTPWTVIGGALLGLGAFVNGACVFGAIARFGSGQWAYLLTPVGFYLGCVSVTALFGAPAHSKLPYGSPVLSTPAWVAGLFVLFVVWRLARPLWRREPVATQAENASLLKRASNALAARIWSPHAATIVIGITFVVMLLAVGAWAYTDVLAELARGMAASLVARLMTELRPRGNARWPLEMGELRTYRGVLRHADPDDRQPQRGSASAEGSLSVNGVGEFRLPGWGGCLLVERAKEQGVPLAWLGRLELKARSGAEQFQLGLGRPPRSLKKQYQAQADKLTDEEKSSRAKAIDSKQKALQRNYEDAQAEFQQAEQDVINRIGAKMLTVLEKYSNANGFAVVLDVSNPQTSPVLWATQGTVITKELVEAYNAEGGSAAPASKPAAGAAGYRRACARILRGRAPGCGR